MKTWKLVSGILSTVLFLVVAFQSCAAGIVNTIEGAGGSSGTAGILVAILMLSGGIVSIAGYGNYSDLVIWALWCLICATLAVVSMLKKKG